MYLENELDKFLKIKTSGRDASNSNYLNFPYEATPYSVLQELANSGHITKKDILYQEPLCFLIQIPNIFLPPFQYRTLPRLLYHQSCRNMYSPN